jgi:Flp pilus assembly pilin Flp
MRIVSWLRRFVGDDSGQDLVEYALLVALIVLVAIAAVDATGDSVGAMFTNIANQFAGVASSA